MQCKSLWIKLSAKCININVLAEFIDWSILSFLDINLFKTKDMIIDFRKNPTDISPVVINDHVVEVVHQFKYLCTVIDEKLTFEAHVNDLCKKAHQHMFYLRKLCSFYMNSTFMKMFYSCCTESVISFSFVCWYGSLNVNNRNRLQGIVKVCGKIVGTTLNYLNDLYKVRILKKAELIMNDPSHPLQNVFRLRP